jgi:hypothetical protein
LSASSVNPLDIFAHHSLNFAGSGSPEEGRILDAAMVE